MWLGRFTRPHFRKKVRSLVVAAKRQGTVPLFTVMRAVSDRCGPTYTAGGPAEDARTRAWYRRLARTLGHSRVVIAYEPDSLGTIDCHARSRRDDRLRLLRYGVKVLSRNPNATLYLEGGASDWEPARRTARQLRAIGIARVRGFMLNATHMDWTRANIRRARDLPAHGRQALHHQHRRERPRPDPQVADRTDAAITVWCNPPNRGLGPAPTTNTSNPRADAYLWINRPGYAQGCQGRSIGWYAPRALSYAKYATRWESPPPGTKNGFRAHR